jgi:hypothetical protein
MFLRVKSVRHIRAYELRLQFSDGVVKDVDLSNELYGKVFEPLRDPAFFCQLRVNEETNTIECRTVRTLLRNFFTRRASRRNRSRLWRVCNGVLVRKCW